MLRAVIHLVSFLALVAVSITPALAAKRVALVIGNSAYEHATALKNPKNDAEAIAAVLEKLGFEVVTGIDLKHLEFARTVAAFRKKIKNASVALFFYAGHGLQVDGRNYLMPVDAELEDEYSLEFEAVTLKAILRLMEREERTNLVFLDACRDNPLARNLARGMGTRSAAIGRGMARVETGIGTMIAFATQPGNVSLDGKGKNSPFTEALLNHIETPGLDIANLMRQVRFDVLTRTRRQQVPWNHSSLTGSFMFNKGSAAASPLPGSTPQSTPSQAPSQSSLAAAYAATEKIATCVAYKSFEETYPGSFYARLANAWQLKNCAERDAAEKTTIASLPDDGQPQTADAADMQELTRALQSELKRVGCDPGKADGQWGSKGRSALERFNKHASLSLPADKPSQAVLDALKEKKARVCPEPPKKKQPVKKPSKKKTAAKKPSTPPSNASVKMPSNRRQPCKEPGRDLLFWPAQGCD